MCISGLLRYVCLLGNARDVSGSLWTKWHINDSVFPLYLYLLDQILGEHQA